MKTTFRKSTIAVATALTFTSVPAFAQSRAVSRGAMQAPAPRIESHPAESRPMMRAEPQRQAPAAIAVPRAVPRTVVPESRPYMTHPDGGRPYYDRDHHDYDRDNHYYYGTPYYARPYAFRPRLSIGLGFWMGYPVPYEYAYPYPVDVYGYSAPADPIVVGPGATQYGGVSLEVSPSDAAVYVDGSYAGQVRDFDGTQQTLTLTLGHHTIQISARDYESMSFDIDTVPGQIVPFRGDLQPLR